MGGLPLAEELERKQLLAMISQVERNMALTVNSEVSNALLTYLNSLKSRLGALEERQKNLEEQKERTESIQRVAVMVERETALNAAEKERYNGFLEQECFTRADFSSLDEFYANTWDRLTAGGKAQMSHRIWEGVRREEYRFSELPETVKEKEAQRLRDAFRAESRMHDDLTVIPEQDRNDFISTWDAGRKHESYQVLNRPSFAKSVAVSAATEPDKAVATHAVKGNAVKDAMMAKMDVAEKPSGMPEVMDSVEFKAGDLVGLSLCVPDMQTPLSNRKKPVDAQGKVH